MKAEQLCIQSAEHRTFSLDIVTVKLEAVHISDADKLGDEN